MESTFAFKRRVEQTFAITFLAVNFVRFFSVLFIYFLFVFVAFLPFLQNVLNLQAQRERERETITRLSFGITI